MLGRGAWVVVVVLVVVVVVDEVVVVVGGGEVVVVVVGSAVVVVDVVDVGVEVEVDVDVVGTVAAELEMVGADFTVVVAQRPAWIVVGGGSSVVVVVAGAVVATCRVVATVGFNDGGNAMVAVVVDVKRPVGIVGAIVGVGRDGVS